MPPAVEEGSGYFLNELLGFHYKGKYWLKTPKKSEVDIK